MRIVPRQDGESPPPSNPDQGDQQPTPSSQDQPQDASQSQPQDAAPSSTSESFQPTTLFIGTASAPATSNQPTSSQPTKLIIDTAVTGPATSFSFPSQSLPTPTPTPTTTSLSSSSIPGISLTMPVLIGIVVGGVGFLVCVLILVVVLYKRAASRKKRAQSDNQTSKPAFHPNFPADTESGRTGGGGGYKSRMDELTPPPTPRGQDKANERLERERDMQALDALVSALDSQAEKSRKRNGAQRYDPKKSNWDEEYDDDDDDDDEPASQKKGNRDPSSHFSLPPVEVFKAALAPEKP